MPITIVNATISSDLKANPDQIWAAEALPSNTTKLSSEFKLGQTMGGVEVKVVCETGGTLTAALNIHLQTATTSGGSFATLLTQTVAIGAITAQQELARFIIPREVSDRMYTKIALVTTANESAMKVDAYPVFVS